MQVAKYPTSHLEACGWYLDCSRAFVPDEEEAHYGNLVNSGPDVIELDEDPDEPTLAPPSVEKDVAPVKGKGRGKNVLAHASSQVSSRSNAKASVQHNVAPATTVVGSPTGTPSTALANMVVPHITGIDLMFADVPENLRVPGNSASSSDVPLWNIRSANYFEVLFAYAGANLHDNGVLVFAHAADPEVLRLIHNWAHTLCFYVAEDWFGMSDLDLLSPFNPSELVLIFGLHPFSLIACFFCFCSPNSSFDNLCRLASSSSRCLCVSGPF